MRILFGALLSIVILYISSCSSVAVTRIPDNPPAEADKVAASATDTRKPGPQQTQAAVLGKWRLVSSSGGYTGKDNTKYTNDYYTFTADSFIVTRNGSTERGKYEWKQVKDIHNEKMTYLMSGVDWTFSPQGKDTLYADMNAYDGYRYLLVRIKK